MKKVNTIIFLLGAIIISGSVMAGNLSFVEIQNKFQADVLREVVGTAFVRIENEFLVDLSSSQIQQLARAGIFTRVIAEDCDLEKQFIVRPRKDNTLGGLDLNLIGNNRPLGHGLSLLETGQFSARTIDNDPDYFISPLTEINIRISYLPQSIYSTFADVSDFPTDTLADLISQDSLYSYDSRLEAFETRYIYTDSIDVARDWLVQKFYDFGYSAANVSTPSFYFNGWQYNVMAIKQGYAEPDKVIVIGGHYDSVTYGQSPGPDYYAPGADDNGSGTSLTLELARVLANIPTRKTIIFMPFSAEEFGLIGSGAAALDFLSQGTDVEVMFNYDMVAHTGGTDYELNYSSGTNFSYRNMAMATANRVQTGMTPVVQAMGSSSDHYSFYSQGFNVVNHIEHNFNTAGWHTNLDNTSRLDYPYFADVARGAVASIAYVANSAHPTYIESIVDVGDGQSLEILWSDCDPNYTYQLSYGTSPGSYSTTIEIPNGNCSHVINGLTDGTPYYISVIGSTNDGYPALFAAEDSLTPLMYPRIPKGLTIEPGYQQINLDWGDNVEGDLVGYSIYRQAGGLGYSLLVGGITESVYIDYAVSGQTEYGYKITAVDLDGFESDLSLEVTSYAATFDGGILVADEVSETNPMPDQPEQEIFYDFIFDSTAHTIYQIEAGDDAITKNLSGQFSSIFWFDGDLSPKLYLNSEDSMKWYNGFTNDIFMCGFSMLKSLVPSTIDPSSSFYSVFGISGHVYNGALDFAGATGQNGWPDAVLDPANFFGNIPHCSKLTLRPGASVIYTFDSFTDNPAFEGQPCGSVYETANGKRVFLSFPLFFLTDESAKAIITKAKEVFGESTVVESNGDVNGDGRVDISDITAMVDYMFRMGPPPVSMNGADADGSCIIDITDLTHLVSYLFLGGLPPLPGCVE